MIPGALLASGRSVRMGRAKALLPTGPGGPSFVRTLANALRAGGIDDLLVVGRPEDEPLQREVETLGPGVRFVVNAHADDGQISSIVAAVNVVDRPGVRGLLVLPVDQPLVSSTTVATLLQEFDAAHPALARVRYQGRAGHPVVFSRALFDELRHADRSIGAKDVLRRHATEILEVEVEDEGVILDIDDAAAYRRAFGVSI